MATNFCSAFLRMRKAKRTALLSLDLMISTATWRPRVIYPCSLTIIFLKDELSYSASCPICAEFLLGLFCPKEGEVES